MQEEKALSRSRKMNGIEKSEVEGGMGLVKIVDYRFSEEQNNVKMSKMSFYRIIFVCH